MPPATKERETVERGEWLPGRFEEHRPHPHAVAHRMPDSLSEAEYGKFCARP